ncbi:MAG: PilZ domain-containing protein [Pseudobdellovibrionaceae bacterium]
MKYVIHHRGQQKGPLEIDEVLKCIEKKEVEWTDYVYDENKKDWILLLDHPTFHDYFRRWKQPTQKSQAPRPNEGAEWYVLRDDNKYGPFSFVEMVKMLQEKKLFEFDYAWNRTKMNSWYRISEIDDFQPEKIKALKDQDPGNMTDVFYRRRHARARYGASILLHNNKEVWRGMSLEVSAGGAGLVIESDEIQVGQSLFLHFKAGDGVPPFNAVCTIVSKTPIKGLEHRYGIKFTSISQTIQQAIKKYTDNAA